MRRGRPWTWIRASGVGLPRRRAWAASSSCRGGVVLRADLRLVAAEEVQLAIGREETLAAHTVELRRYVRQCSLPGGDGCADAFDHACEEVFERHLVDFGHSRSGATEEAGGPAGEALPIFVGVGDAGFRQTSDTSTWTEAFARAALRGVRTGYDEANEWFARARGILDDQDTRPLRDLPPQRIPCVRETSP